MDSRYNNNPNSSSSSSSSNNNNNGKERKSRDRGALDHSGGQGYPGDYHYPYGGYEGMADAPHEEDLYATNNNDYSKYNNNNNDHLTTEYGYGCDSARGQDACYSSSSSHSPYDASYSDDYGGGDYGRHHHRTHHDYHSVSSDCQCQQQCHQGGYSSCSCSPGYGDHHCDSYGTCSQPEYTPSPVQVTAKVLFGSVSAISNLKQKKTHKK